MIRGRSLPTRAEALTELVVCTWHRNGSVLLWLPLLLLGPLLDLHGDLLARTGQLGLLVVIAGAAITATVTSGRARSGLVPVAALLVLCAATALGTTQGWPWLHAWTLVALTVPGVFRGAAVVAVLGAVTAATAATAYALEGALTPSVWALVFVTALAGVANTAVLRLVEAVAELRRTRAELARSAVLAERERFSRDLHDLLGHTLSVMVVKAQAVRRLADHDPPAAAEHARDVEDIGREALRQVREAVDAMRSATLQDEVAGARRALEVAGIRAEVAGFGRPLPESVDAALAWVVREATTNVLRHSEADRCWIELEDDDGQVALTVRDDGGGSVAASPGRRGGLAGLRDRLAAIGGGLEVDGADGFRVTARLPAMEGAR